MTLSVKKNDDDCELREEYDLSQLPVMPKGRYARRAMVALRIYRRLLVDGLFGVGVVNLAWRLVLVGVILVSLSGGCVGVLRC